MVILAIGLLALAGLQARLHVLQIESYQRAQALILLGDMANRLTNNRYDAASYVTVDPLGTGNPCPVAPANRQEADAVEWCNDLIGAGEELGGGNVGTLVGGRGCVEGIADSDGDGIDDEFMITVAWQGLAPVSAPPASVSCGADEYDDAGTPCDDDLCRRVVTTVVRIPDLT
jgi:type IV pilus assembly protein PilV